MVRVSTQLRTVVAPEPGLVPPRTCAVPVAGRRSHEGALACPARIGRQRMIDLHYRCTPNGLTLTLFLQETGIEHRIIAVDIGAGEQMACYPWVVPHEAHGQDLVEFPNLRRWFDTIAVRPATQRAYEGVTSSYSRSRAPMSDEARTILFGQR